MASEVSRTVDPKTLKSNSTSIALPLQQKQENLKKVLEILEPLILNDEKNYGLSDMEIFNLKTYFQDIDFLDQFKIKLYFRKCEFLNLPAIKDEENYVYFLKTFNNKDKIYYY